MKTNPLFHIISLSAFFVCLCSLPAAGVISVTPGPVVSGVAGGYTLAMSSDGGYVVVGSEWDEYVRVYRSNGTLYGNYTLPSGIEMESADMSPYGDEIVIGTQGGGIHCIFRDGSFLWSQPLISGEVCVAIKENGALVYAGSSNKYYRLDGSNGTIIDNNVTIPSVDGGIKEVRVNSDGTRVLLRCFRNVIITDAFGTELYVFPFTTGSNYTGGADLSVDGDEFVISYRDDSNQWWVAKHSVAGGELWKKEVNNQAGVRMDLDGKVFVATQTGDNKLLGPDGGEIVTWTGVRNYIDIAHNGSKCINPVSDPDSQIFTFTDTYTCYPDLYMPAYLLDIDTDSSPTHDYYTFALGNWQDLPDELFVHSPELPACGLNTEASRTYGRIKGDNGTQYGNYCAIYDKSIFSDFTMLINKTTIKPDHFYFELWDRKCDQYLYSTYMQADHDCPIGDLNGDCIVNLIDLSMLSSSWLLDNN